MNNDCEEKQLLSETGQEGRRWMVLISCFFTKMFIQGIRKSFGVLLPTLQREFNTEVWLLGSIVAVFCAVGDFIGPVVGGLAHRFSCRGIVMIGGALMCLGMILASQMPDVWTMALMLVLFCGIGLGFIVDPPFAVLGQYFEDNYSFANGFAFLGSSTALIIFGPLTQILETTYGWRGTVLVLGGIFFHVVVCGALLKPYSRKDGSEEQGYLQLNSSPGTSGTSQTYDIGDEPRGCTYSLGQCCSSMFESLHLAIFKDPVFYVIIIVSCTIRFTYTAWVIYLVPRAIDTGVPPLQATLVATVGGVGDAVGKIIPGFFKWKDIANTKTLWICGMSVMTLSLILCIWVPTFAGMLVLAFFQGFGLGMSHSLINVVYKEIFGIDRLVNAMGWLRCFSGLGRVLGGFVPGWIYKTSGSYDYAFVTLGCVQGFGLIIFIVYSSCTSEEKFK